MKRSALTLGIFFLTFIFSWAAGSEQALETQKEKESYSIGYQVGLSIMADDVEVDFQTLVAGLQDAIDKEPPLLNNDEMKGLIVALKQKAQAGQMRKIQDIAAKNAEESEKFLMENGKKPGITSTESGLQYRVLKQGKGPSPDQDDYVAVNYRGTFIDGKEFDGTAAQGGAPQTFRTNGVIKGWTEALQMMKEGSKWELYVPPSLAYGRGGLGTKIPPNKVLVFELELLSVEKRKKAAMQ